MAHRPPQNPASETALASAPWTLGLSLSHNGSACLLRGDEVVVAIQEERLTRTKRQQVRADRDALCIRYCLDAAGIEIADLDAVAVAVLDDRNKNLRRLRRNPHLAEIADTTPLLAFTHHRAHAAYGVATAGARRSAVLVADGMGSPFDTLDPDEQSVMAPAEVSRSNGTAGPWESISIYEFADGVLTPRFKQMATAIDGRFEWDGGATSITSIRILGLGGMYERASQVIFGVGQASGKVMGLAPLGRPTLPVHAFHSARKDGALAFLNPPELSEARLETARKNRAQLKPTAPESADLAASVQRALEEGMLHFSGLAKRLTSAESLVLSGGVALNGVANERIVRETGFSKVHLPPAVEDCGNAIGAAYLALWERHGWRPTRSLRVDATGRPHRAREIDAAVSGNPGVRSRVLGDRMIDEAVARLIDGEILGWVQGGSELGPRALGQRSILCDPRPADAKDRLNARVKRREGFRPFAPLVLAEHAEAWFDLTCEGRPVDPDGPFMTRVVPVRVDKRALIPAVTHVDGTGRFQTVTPENGPIHELLSAFYRRTGVPILLNTSFNLADEPIAETPADALFDLLVTDIDAVVARDRLIERIEGRGPGILDLIPSVIGQRLSKEVVERERLHEHSVVAAETAVGSPLKFFFRVSYPQGEMAVKIFQDELALLMLMDGRRSGRDLLPLVGAMLREERGERWLETALAGLARRRVIELSFRDLGAVDLSAGSRRS